MNISSTYSNILAQILLTLLTFIALPILPKKYQFVVRWFLSGVSYHVNSQFSLIFNLQWCNSKKIY